MIYLENDFESGDQITKVEKLNIDDLFITKQKQQIREINTFNKILNKINEKIKYISKRAKNNNFLSYNVPLFILGYSNYNINDCIAYITVKLEENGFSIQYVPPNTLFISWAHYVPTYIRNELKKKTGIIFDSNGNQIKKIDNEDNLNNLLTQNKKNNDNKKENINKYNPIIPY
jgi:hypothetical protein